MQNATETTTAPEPTGLPAETGSQGQKPPEQSGASAQPGSQGQIETPEQQVSRQPEARPEAARPSDYYQVREMKKIISNLTREFQDFKTKFQQPQSAPAQAPTDVPLPKSILDDPDKAWNALVSELSRVNKKLQEVETGIPQKYEEWNQKRQFETADQEAAGFIAKAGIPKEDAVQFIIDNGLQSSYMENPAKVAEIVVKLMKADAKPPNPNIPKKGQMVSTVSGVPAQSQSNQSNVESMRKQLREMTIQMGANPNLRYDPQFKAKIDEIQKKVMEMSAKSS